MHRLNYLMFAGMLLFCTNLYANEASLNLQCEVHFSNFHNIKQASTGKKVRLKNLKQQSGGAVLVTQTDDYEFWVMTHSQQTINKQRFINNFQVAIKDKKSGLFMHALSDSSYSPGKQPGHARISLVDYYPGSFLEKGELFFECHHVKE